ncbi:hypothetical protein NDU88_007265 [Pleurodeles waltl]|uniref:Uncharacterized protein n=1 Tax=Pleurodeles waltl TaxID=8319 RepID=A0AAV7SSB7_PLEWA|nr:hypothetical protein NDU88_007265 [Pleurodeles waltl]
MVPGGRTPSFCRVGPGAGPVRVAAAAHRPRVAGAGGQAFGLEDGEGSGRLGPDPSVAASAFGPPGGAVSAGPLRHRAEGRKGRGPGVANGGPGELGRGDWLLRSRPAAVNGGPGGAECDSVTGSGVWRDGSARGEGMRVLWSVLTCGDRSRGLVGIKSVVMASTKPKRDQSVREMLTRSHPSQSRQAEAAALERGPEGQGEVEADGESPVTKGFLTSLFNSLRVDLQERQRDISQEMRELRSDITSLGERVSSMANNEISRGEEVEQLQQEIPRLREQQEQLQIATEDLENRSRRHNIRIRGVPHRAEGDDIREFVTALFRSLLSPENTQEITLDRRRRELKPTSYTFRLVCQWGTRRDETSKYAPGGLPSAGSVGDRAADRVPRRAPVECRLGWGRKEKKRRPSRPSSKERVRERQAALNSITAGAGP